MKTAVDFDMIEKISLIQIEKLDEASIAPLIKESLSQGFQFVERLIEEYQTGKNCFNKTGEALFAALIEEEIVAIGGLNRDPYVNPADKERVGRLRHVYVMTDWRRKRIGCLLVEQLIETAIPHFDKITLRTDTPEANRFYQHLGFRITSQWEHASHVLDLSERMLQRS